MHNLLDGSQTFLGTLLTLNVLCIFANRSNNFILKLLSNLIKAFKSELKNLKKLIEADVEKIKNSEDFKTVEKISASQGGYPPKIVTEATLLSYKYSLGSETSQIALTKGYVQLNQIKHSQEQFRAPLFTLLYGLTIFVIDEVCRFTNDECLYKAYLFCSWIITVLAILYWLIIWIVFVVSSYPLPQRKKGSFWSYVDYTCHSVDSAFVQLVIFATIYYFVLKFLLFATSIMWVNTLLILVAALLPLLILGIWRESECSVIGRYSYMHVCGHFVTFLIYAIILTVITYNSFNFCLQSSTIFTDVPLLRLFVVGFVLLNGLLLPFILPYGKHRDSYLTASHELEAEHAKVIKAKRDFEADFASLCKGLVININRTSLSNTPTNLFTETEFAAVKPAKPVDWKEECMTYDTCRSKVDISTYCELKGIDVDTFNRVWSYYLRSKG